MNAIAQKFVSAPVTAEFDYTGSGILFMLSGGDAVGASKQIFNKLKDEHIITGITLSDQYKAPQEGSTTELGNLHASRHGGRINMSLATDQKEQTKAVVEATLNALLRVSAKAGDVKSK